MLKFALAATVLLSAGLAGCGENSQAAPPPPPAPRGIFISASDCAGADKISLDECGRAIDLAVAAYERTAPAFKSLRSCEAASGVDRCAKNVDGRYRAQLQAFLVTMSKPASAIALSPPAKKAAGFKSAQGAVAAFSEEYSISAAAQTLASDNNRLADTAVADF